MVFDEDDDSHSATAIRTEERVHFIDLADHLCPPFPGEKCSYFLNDRRMSRVFTFLAFFATMGIRVEAVITCPLSGM
ncbi:MAG: hypothetical protein KAU46_07280 [Candidatus Aminicenantes bacterium]|nr:hypothetical protein [Candidatus Aminicenantes bacterium]